MPVENEAIYVWLVMPGATEPCAYALPWSLEAAQQLQDAMNQAEADGTAVLMGMPFEASLDDREPMFYAMPQPAMPPKDYPEGAPSSTCNPMRPRERGKRNAAQDPPHRAVAQRRQRRTARSDCQSERSGHSGPAVPAWAPPHERAPRQKDNAKRLVSAGQKRYRDAASGCEGEDGSFSLTHWLVVLAIILILFGAGKLPRVMGDFAKGIKNFKAGMKDDDEPASAQAKLEDAGEPTDRKAFSDAAGRWSPVSRVATAAIAAQLQSRFDQDPVGRA